MDSVPDRPLDDETLSLVLDDDAVSLAGLEALSGEARNRAELRLAALGAARHALSTTPQPPTAEQREMAIAAAMDEARQSGLIGTAGGAAGGTGASVTNLATARRWRRPTGQHLRWLGAAAAALALVVAVGPLLSGSDDTADSAGGDTAAAGDGDLTQRAAAGQGATDLGAASEPDELAALVESALGESRTTADAASGGAATAAPAESDDGFAGSAGQSAEPESRDVASDASDGAAPGIESCRHVVPRDFPDAAELVFSATLRWQGTPSVLHVHRLTAGDGDYGVWVFDTDCSVVVFVSVGI